MLEILEQIGGYVEAGVQFIENRRDDLEDILTKWGEKAASCIVGQETAKKVIEVVLRVLKALPIVYLASFLPFQYVYLIAIPVKLLADAGYLRSFEPSIRCGVAFSLYIEAIKQIALAFTCANPLYVAGAGLCAINGTYIYPYI